MGPDATILVFWILSFKPTFFFFNHFLLLNSNSCSVYFSKEIKKVGMGFIGIIGVGSKYTFIYLPKQIKRRKGQGHGVRNKRDDLLWMVQQVGVDFSFDLQSSLFSETSRASPWSMAISASRHGYEWRLEREPMVYSCESPNHGEVQGDEKSEAHWGFTGHLLVLLTLHILIFLLMITASQLSFPEPVLIHMI